MKHTCLYIVWMIILITATLIKEEALRIKKKIHEEDEKKVKQNTQQVRQL